MIIAGLVKKNKCLLELILKKYKKRGGWVIRRQRTDDRGQKSTFKHRSRVLFLNTRGKYIKK